jgi:hypothetical protein
VGAGSGPPGWARIIHHGADKLLVKQDTVPGGEFTSPVQEGTQQTHPLSSTLLDLIDVRRPGGSFVWDHPQITSCVDPLDWLPEKCYLSGLDETPSGPPNDYRGAL